MQNQPHTLIHRDAKSPNFYNNGSRSFKHIVESDTEKNHRKHGSYDELEKKRMVQNC